MSGQHVGYIRVSSIVRNRERQLHDVQLDETFTDKLSAKDAKRPALQECLRHVRSGDTLHVHSIDRLARNLKDLQAIMDDLVQRGVAVHFHKEGMTFTGDANPLQRVMLQMMGAFAEFERSLINERQREGMAIARAKGKPIGRPRKLDSSQSAALIAAIASGEPKAKVARRFGISRRTVYDVLAENNNAQRNEQASL